MAVAVLAEQVRRTLRDPTRLRRLHYSNVLAAAHLLVEPDDAGVVARVFGVARGDVHDDLVHALVSDRGFAEAIEQRYLAVRGTRLRLFGVTSAEDADARCRLLYCCVRLLRPRVVLETGVFDGVSTSIILKALADNGTGRLESIDLPPHAPVRASTDKMPATTLPPGQPSGWLVPDALRARWTLHLGSATDLLPACLHATGGVDLFFHDSMHTAAHMTWEYDAVWPVLSSGGLLVSDDVFWSTAFWRFCRRHRVRGVVARGMGLVRKP